MKKLAIMLIMALAFISSVTKVAAETKSIRAVVTYYWPGENGGRYDCDGNKLYRGVAAVDFDVIPKNTKLNIGDCFHVIAKDCGGSSIISRKAARLRGVHCPVIDVWVKSESEAMRMEANLPSVVTVTYEDAQHRQTEDPKEMITVSHDIPLLAKHGYARSNPSFVCYNSKCVHEHARIERYDARRMLAYN